MPRRIQMSRQRPWRAEHPDAVIVARPSVWGNPYRWQDVSRRLIDLPRSDADRRRVVVGQFRLDLRDGVLDGYPTLAEIRTVLTGRDLACWCPLDEPCHADVLLELANGGEVGTGAGRGDDPASTEATSWVNGSQDCPEAPAQAHLPAAGGAR